ncbi:hypothetical protein GCM10011409_21250 [Lentibacillus populi]|uniref:Uncharacterized protein n=1 Tax=Lentibacillus populi TaxID=1827502 RepID=A0A9W5TXR3_9BACI|nr:hypothetical protein [Lentibacillus populi]MBT2215878.1 hypothetical protein [Virgibacillus dakarensis]MBT2215950.1 hypothetical protein [Virgibacillus dakarensis]GGB43387.1 hypothetical protein GCM10011409_21250 [Lentibacillus populi]
MLYVKTKINDQVEMKVDLYEDEIFSSCPVCGKEYQVDPLEIADIISQGDDFPGTSFYCNGCIKGKVDSNATT